jgi:hypothetical protein
MSQAEEIMELTRPNTATTRVLVVADWAADPSAVVAACGRRQELDGAALGLVVPARLHGLDWAGDPAASVPCAQRQLAAIEGLVSAAGLPLATASVGDPDPLAAIGDALADWPADELLLCTRVGRVAFPHPLDLTHRARRLTGLAVSRAELPATRSREADRRRLRFARGHCVLDQPHTA